MIKTLKIIGIVLIGAVIGSSVYVYNTLGTEQKQAITLGGPTTQNFTNIQPFADNTFDNGTSTNAWKHVYTYGLNFSTTTGGCLESSTSGVVYMTGTNCGTGSGGSGGLGTTSPWTIGNLAMVSSNGSVTSVATTTLSGTGLISVTAGAYTLGGTPVVVSCSTCSGFPFTVDSYAGATVVSTTTGLWLKDLTPYSLIASSTLFTYASSTLLDVSSNQTIGGNLWVTNTTGGLWLGALNNFDIGYYRSSGGDSFLRTANTDRITIQNGGNVGISSSTPTFTLSVGESNTGTFGISTTTNGCGQYTNGLLWITGTACGSGGAGTNYFTNSGINTFLNTGSILGTPTIKATSTAATSTIAYLNNTFYVPEDFATNGCANDATKITLDTCVEALLALAVAKGLTGATIWITADVPQSAWTATMDIAQNGLQTNLFCRPGTRVKYGGSGNAILWNNGDPTGHVKQEIAGCLFMGQNSLIAAGQSNSTTTVGIYYGGANGAVGINTHDNTFNGFGTQIEVGANAYMLEWNNNGFSGGNGGRAAQGSLVHINTASNSGERNVFDGNNFTDPANSDADECIYIEDGGTASNFFTNNSIDNCQIYAGASNGQVVISFNHFENPGAPSGFAEYIPILNPSSDQSTQITLIGNEFANSASNRTWDTIVKHGGQFYAASNNIQNYNSGTIANFVDHSNNNGQATDMVCQLQVQGGTLTNIVAGGGGVPWSATNGVPCVYNRANSYTIGLRALSSNTNEFFSGNSTTGSFDHDGNWTLGIAAVPSTVTIQKHLQVGSSNVGNFQIATTATGCLQTSAANSNAFFGSCGTGGGGSDPFTHPFSWLSATTSSMVFGTSTISNAFSSTLTLASSTAPQLSLSAGAGNPIWAFRNAGGNLYLSTTTVSGLATTSTPALSILSTGQIALASAEGSSSAQPLLTIGPGAGDNSHTVDIYAPNTGTQNVVSLIRTANTQNNFLQFQPAGANSPTNVNWIVGTNANSDSFSWSMWDGSSVIQRIALLNSGELGIATTTPSRIAQQTIATSTASQLSLSAGAGVAQWVQRNAGGNLYFATTTVAGTATTSISALTLSASGTGLFVGTTTNSAATGLAVAGTYFHTGLTTAAGTPNSVCINATTKEVTENAALTCTVSSAKFKKDIAKLNLGLDTLMDIEAVEFAYKDNPDRMRYGFIAEQVAGVDKRFGDGYTRGEPNSIDQNAILALTVKSVQELNDKVSGITGEAKKSMQDNWQWVVIGLLMLWNLGLTKKIYAEN